MRVASALAAVAAALALQTTLATLVIGETAAVDLVLVVLVYVAIVSGPVTGLFLGAAAGLVQDTLSSGLVGIGGLAKASVGFVSGLLGTQFIVHTSVARFLVFVIATALHAVVFMGLYVLLDLRRFDAPFAATAMQAAGNGVLGVIGARVVELLPVLRERRRARRTPRR